MPSDHTHCLHDDNRDFFDPQAPRAPAPTVRGQETVDARTDEREAVLRRARWHMGRYDRLLAIEAVEPHYAPALGPNVDMFLTPQTTRFGFDGTGLEELVAVAKACPKYKRNSRELRLRHGDGIEAVVNPDLLLDLLAACGKEAIVVSVKGAIDPVRIDGIREVTIGDHYQRVLGVVMPLRGVQDELPGLSQFRLTYDLPAQMYGEVRIHEKPKAEKGEAA